MSHDKVIEKSDLGTPREKKEKKGKKREGGKIFRPPVLKKGKVIYK